MSERKQSDAEATAWWHRPWEELYAPELDAMEDAAESEFDAWYDEYERSLNARPSPT